MSSPVRSELPVDKGIVLFTEIVGMAQRKFQRLVLVVNDRIQAFSADLVVDEIHQAVFGVITLIVEVKRKPAVKERIHPETAFHIFQLDVVLRKQLAVRDELYKSAVALPGCAVFLVDQLPLNEIGAFVFAVTVGNGGEGFGKCIDRFRAHAVEPDGELEYIRIIFRAGIDLGNAGDQFSKRDTASVVADGQFIEISIRRPLPMMYSSTLLSITSFRST